MTEPNQFPGDENVERLVGQAYRPDPIDPDFVQRVHARLGEVAAERRPQRLSRRRLLAVVGGMAAMVALIVLPQVLWRLAVPTTPQAAETPPPKAGDYRGPERLTVQPRGRTPALDSLSVGAEIRTGAGQRRCVRLPDGSLLSLNENTAARLDSDRRLTLSRGEVFVEVAPRTTSADRFVVRTPQREVIALGTKFAVRATRAGMGVLVTQGKVEVGGLGRILVAGQQLATGSSEVSPAERASHALAWTRDLLARTEPVLVPASEYRGGALVIVGPDGQPSRLSLRRYHVDVHIEDGFARTTIDQTYFNAHGARLEGTFHFPLPADASLSRLAMYVDGTRMEGGMVERDYGRAVYQSIVNRMKDPALLEWVDGTTFKMRVFPLEARQEKRIILSYTQKLPALYGRATYRFPAGHSLEEVRDWSFLARIKDGAKLNWHSPTHLLGRSINNNDLLLTAKEHATRVDRDVVLDLEEPAHRGAGDVVRFSSAEHDGARYLMVRYRPVLPVTPQQAKVPRRDWVFLFESSAERDPLLARTQIEIIRRLLENCGHDDTFAILTADTRCHLLTQRPLAATPANVRQALASLEQAHLIGALDLEKAFAAAEPLLKAGRNPHLVHVGSGLPRLGERRPEVLVKKLPAGTPYIGVGVGKRWNRALMKAAADHSGGYFTQINPDEQIGWRAFDLLATLNTPRLLNVHVEAADKKLTFLTDAASIAQGEELCAVARAEGKEITWPASVAISGTLDGKPFRREFVVAGVVPKADYLPRTWGRLEIDRLLAEGAEKHKQRIIALSKSLYVMSPFTSLLVLENEAMYKQYKVERGRKDHWASYPCPERIPVVTEPLYGPPIVQRVLKLPANGLRWKDVFQWLAKETGKPVISTFSITGHFRYRVPEGRSFTLPQTIDLINEALGEQQFILLQRPRSFTLIPADEKVDPLLLPEIDVKDLAERGNTEIVRLTVQLRDVPAGEALKSVKRMMGKFSEVAAIPAANQLVLIDSVGSIKRALEVLKPIGQQTPQSVLETLVVRSQKQATHRDVDVKGFQDLGVMTIRAYGQRVAAGGSPEQEAQMEALIRRMLSKGFQTASQPDPKVADKLRTERMLEQIKELIRKQERLRAQTEQHRGDAPAYYGPGYQTQLSPYLNFLRGYDPASNFYLGVTPEPPRSESGPGLDPALVQGAMGAIQSRTLIGMAGAPEGPPVTLPPAPGLFNALTQLEQDQEILDRAMKVSGYVPEVLLLQYRRNIQQDREAVNRTLNLLSLDRIWLDLGYPGLPTADSGMREPLVAPDVNQAASRSVASHTPRNLFRDLASFAPGMDSTLVDVLAVLEAEARLPQRVRTGKVVPAARALIDGARSARWESVTIPARDNQDGFTILCDGRGSYRHERTLDTALRELVVCDGKTLLHLYPELGLGARRYVSRFHRRELCALVPWLLPPADDLARGADLELVDKQTVAIFPHQGSVCVHLVFAADGRLAERRLLLKKTGLLRQTYAADGTVRLLDADGKLLSEARLARRAANAPELKPNLADLVVLPLPWRTLKIGDPKKPDHLAKLATLFAEGNSELPKFVTEQFFNKGDRRRGLFTLLAARHELDEKLSRGLELTSKLGGYLLRLDWNDPKERPLKELPLDFFSRMKTLYQLHKLPGDGVLMSRNQEERLLQYVRLCRSPRVLWSLVQVWSAERMPSAEGTAPAKLRPRVLEAAAKGLGNVPGLGYAARYEYARCLLQGDARGEARKVFEELYAKTLASGVLPKIDTAFRRALEDADGTGPWRPLMRRTTGRLLTEGNLPAAFAVVQQCWAAGDVKLGDELVLQVTTAKAPEALRALLILEAVHLLGQAQRDFKADELLREVLAREDAPRDPELWRTASALAGHIDGPRRALVYLEKAAEFAWQARHGGVNVQTVRRDYLGLLGSYGELARAADLLGQRPPAGLVDRVVQAAERWRSLDRDGPAAEKAADVLVALGERELAWDYLTTWLGREDSADGWRKAAENLRLRREHVLAKRALAAATPTSP